MTKSELNSYRFNSGQDPTDEQLHAIMEAAAEDARERAISAQKRYEESQEHYFNEIENHWKTRINSLRNE
ncbi:MAG: hypothetical protein UHP27_00095 [Muribaculaceae bacterium]|nr:hypothetical protein [Muribaculaceae bacterium]